MARTNTLAAAASSALLLILVAVLFERRFCAFSPCFVSPNEHSAPQRGAAAAAGPEPWIDHTPATPAVQKAVRVSDDFDKTAEAPRVASATEFRTEPPKPAAAADDVLASPEDVPESKAASMLQADRRGSHMATDMMRATDLQVPFTRDSSAKGASPEANEGRKANATILTLARNSDLGGVVHSIRQFEKTFNARFRYPYTFLNDKPFTASFVSSVKEAIAESRGVGAAEVVDGVDIEFGLIPFEHWSYPYWINLTIADQWRQDMSRAGVIYGGSESYRHMCRWFSGFFFRHSLMRKYKWYWRLEPDVDYYCDLDYDVFKFMEANKKRYGFNMLMREIPETVPSLWPLSLHFAKYREINSTLIRFFVDPKTLDYNFCHYWSNFEIADMDLWRSPQYLDYFDYLDKWGGFFYERWGDAPVHSLAVGLLLRKDEVHFFEDIGYRHTEMVRCPSDRSKCRCPTKMKNFDYSSGSCLPAWNRYEPAAFLPAISRQ